MALWFFLMASKISCQLDAKPGKNKADGDLPKDIDGGKAERPLLHQANRFHRVGGEGGEGTKQADSKHQAKQFTVRGTLQQIDEEEPESKAPQRIDCEGSPWK